MIYYNIGKTLYLFSNHTYLIITSKKKTLRANSSDKKSAADRASGTGINAINKEVKLLNGELMENKALFLLPVYSFQV